MGNCKSCSGLQGPCATNFLRCLACMTCYKCCDPELAAAVRTKDFTLAGRHYTAKVVDIYDGDTIRVKFRLDGQLHQMVSRMDGYDSPEMKPSKASPHRDEEKKAAVAARDALRQLIGDKIVAIQCGGFDKYGRLLTTVFVRGGGGEMTNVNEWMVRNKYGVPYGGGTKIGFAAQIDAAGMAADRSAAAHQLPAATPDPTTGTRSSAHAIVNPSAFVAGAAHHGNLPVSLVKAAAAPAVKKSATADARPKSGAPDGTDGLHNVELAPGTSDSLDGDGDGDAHEFFRVTADLSDV